MAALSRSYSSATCCCVSDDLVAVTPLPLTATVVPETKSLPVSVTATVVPGSP